MGCSMIRTLHMAGIHGLVSLRLTMSRNYWLPRLTMAVIAGYLLLFSVRYPSGHFMSVTASFVMGFSCIALARPDISSQTLPIPIPQAWLIASNVITQLLVCVAAAFGFLLFDAVCSLLVAYSVTGGDWGLILSQPIPHLLQAEHFLLMALIFVASIPVGIAICRTIIHHRRPDNTLPNQPWQNVLPRSYGITATLGMALLAATEFTAPLFAVRYLQAWLAVALYVAGLATFMYGWAAIFPPEGTRVRPGKPALQSLTSIFWHSQAIKWSFMLLGLTLYMLNPDKLLPSDWAIGRFPLRMMCLLLAALCPLMGMNLITNQVIHGHQWKRSGWSMVPAPRIRIQRILFIDLFGFAVVSTLLLQTVCLVIAQEIEGSPALTPWFLDLITFTWLYSWVTVLLLPTWMVFNIPRRQFGLGLAVATLAASLWALLTTWSHAFGAEDAALAFKLHLMAMSAWVILAAVFWAQITSPTGRLFETGAPANRLSKAIVGFIGARATRWSIATTLGVAIVTGIALHRAGINTELERIQTHQITSAQTDRLIADIEHIKTLDLFKTTPRERNAGVILNRHIGLDDGTPAQDVAWWDDIKHKRTLNRRNAHWSTAPDDVEVGDLSLLTKLMAFDHWETGRLPSEYGKTYPAQGPYEEYLRDTPRPVYLNHFQPYPNPVSLVDLAKFRLLHGLRTDDVLPALKEVRHLATLLHSDETMIHTVLAIAILRMERRAFDAAMDRGQLGPTDWTVPTNADLNTMHRVAVSMAFVMSGGAAESQWQRIAALGDEPFGLCGAIHDAVSNSVTQPHVQLWPGELLPVPDMGFLDLTIATSSCNNPLARHDHNLAQKARQGFDALPTDQFFRVSHRSEMMRLLSNEFEDSTILALAVPYLRGNAWMEIQESMHMGGVLMYGETPEADWNGSRVRRKSSDPRTQESP